MAYTHACVLKSCAESSVNPLQQSLNSGELPLEWKQANIQLLPFLKRALELRLQTTDQSA